MTTELKPWVGIDLDGTLAHYYGWTGVTNIGEPLQPMVERVKHMLKAGTEVRIMTARVCSIQPPGVADAAREAIGQWCEKHIGQRLKVTAEKDYMMELLFDDRAVPVEFNTGRIGT